MIRGPLQNLKLACSPILKASVSGVIRESGHPCETRIVRVLLQLAMSIQLPYYLVSVLSVVLYSYCGYVFTEVSKEVSRYFLLFTPTFSISFLKSFLPSTA